jgi:hypothetical protein
MDDQSTGTIPDFIPQYTGSLDANVPGENIVCIQYDDSSKKWVAINRNEQGLLHVGVGNTEALARRIAGLKAFAARDAATSTPVILTQRENLIDALDKLTTAIEKNNEYRMAEPEDQQRRVTEIRSLRDMVRSPGALAAGAAAILMATLTYLAIKFADNLIGKLAETAARYLEQLIGG